MLTRCFTILLFSFLFAISGFSGPNFQLPIKNKNALSLLIKQAKLGGPKAQYLLGSYYMTKDPNKKNNYYNTIRWFKKALNSKYTPAGYSLGLYLLKQKNKKQYKIATQALLASSELGCPYSHYLLGIIFQQRAAEQGIDWAAYIQKEDEILNTEEIYLPKE